jgi:hypothetical protein
MRGMSLVEVQQPRRCRDATEHGVHGRLVEAERVRPGNAVVVRQGEAVGHLVADHHRVLEVTAGSIREFRDRDHGRQHRHADVRMLCPSVERSRVVTVAATRSWSGFGPLCGPILRSWGSIWRRRSRRPWSPIMTRSPLGRRMFDGDPWVIDEIPGRR